MSKDKTFSVQTVLKREDDDIVHGFLNKKTVGKTTKSIRAAWCSQQIANMIRNGKLK